MPEPGDAPFEAVHVDDLERIDVAGVHWRPVRRRLGISAFGTNAYTADAGELIVEPHDERGGHEELYVVLRGRARFTVAGEQLDAKAGTLVFVRDPQAEREAVAEEDGTTVLAVGGMPGAAGPPSAWEWTFAAAPLRAAGRHREAAELIAQAFDVHPGDAGVHFHVARALAAAGDHARAREHLRTAVAARPELAERARQDAALAALGDPEA